MGDRNHACRGVTVAIVFAAAIGMAPAAQGQSARDRAEARKHISLLRSKDKARAQAAARALMGMKERAIYDLVRSLGDKDGQVRSYCSLVLSKIGKPSIAPLIKRLADKNQVLRYEGAIDDNKMRDKAPDDETNYVINAVRQLIEGETVAPDQTKPYGCSVKYKRQ